MTKQKKSVATEPNHTPLVIKQEQPATYRYYCDSCTGIAFIYTEGQNKPMMVSCGKCGRANEFKEANLIRL